MKISHSPLTTLDHSLASMVPSQCGFVLHRMACELAGDSLQAIDLLVRPERFERPTPWFVAKYSIQLSYGRLNR